MQDVTHRNGGGQDPAQGLLLRPRAAPQPPPPLRDPRLWAALAALLVHVLGTSWLFRHGVALPPTQSDLPGVQALRVEWIELSAPPPPQAPGLGDPRPNGETRSASVVPSSGGPLLEATPEEDDAANQSPSGGRSLLGQVGPGVRAVVGATELPRRDALEPGFRVPGRGEPFVEGFHVRAEVSVQDRIHQIGALIGGGRYDPCPDIASRLRDARNEAERRELMDRLRRACGRQRGLP